MKANSWRPRTARPSSRTVQDPGATPTSVPAKWLLRLRRWRQKPPRSIVEIENGPTKMHAFTILSDPVRRRILEHLCVQDLSSGEIVSSVGDEFGISQSAISQHLKVLRENRFANVRVDGARRIYSFEPSGLEDVDSVVGTVPTILGTKVCSSRAGVGTRDNERKKSDKETKKAQIEHGRMTPHHPLFATEQRCKVRHAVAGPLNWLKV